MNLYIHPKSQAKLAVITQNLPHALLLTGPHGVGLATIAKHVSSKNLASLIEPIDSKGNADHQTGTISVETIRQLYDQTRAIQSKAQVFIIDNAERMSLGAQAAFLKLLEEPNENVHFLFTSHFPQNLLPTVRSRVQTLTIDPVAAEQTLALLNDFKVVDAKKRAQLNYLAAGLPAELVRLMSNDTHFTKRAEVMADTRTFLTGSTYQKLLVVNNYQEERSKAIQLIDSALAVTKRSVNDQPQAALIKQLDMLLTLRGNLDANCNARLQLMSFVVQ